MAPARTIMAVAAAGLLLAGCDAIHDADADRLIRPAAGFGKLMFAMTGSDEQLIAKGRISRHEVVASFDATPIDVWVIASRLPGSPARGTVVLLHPMMTSKSWFLPLGEKLADRGWDVVLPDLRTHGRSGGEYITWGAREKRDIKAVADRLVADGLVSDRIYVCGASIGAAVAIQYAAVEPRCRGVMAIAPPKSCREITRRLMPLARQADYDEALRRASERAGFDPDDASAEAAAAHLRCPLILVHGALDLAVPIAHGKAVFAAAPEPKKFYRLPLDGHACEIAREGWIADRIDELAEMGKPTPAAP